MLKLNASFSKKVPAEQEYSSKGYSATIEVELPDGLSQEQLQERIHQTFALVEASVEAELNGNVITAVPVTTDVTAAPTPEVNKTDPESASPKQVKYLMDLARKGQVPLEGYLNNYGLQDVSELTRQQASYIIDEIRKQAA